MYDVLREYKNKHKEWVESKKELDELYSKIYSKISPMIFFLFKIKDIGFDFGMTNKDTIFIDALDNSLQTEIPFWAFENFQNLKKLKKQYDKEEYRTTDWDC